jgi:hypothetical protein
LLLEQGLAILSLIPQKRELLLFSNHYTFLIVDRVRPIKKNKIRNRESLMEHVCGIQISYVKCCLNIQVSTSTLDVKREVRRLPRDIVWEPMSSILQC